MADKAFDAEHTFLDAVDDFTVLFHSDRVFVREQEYPVGQYVVDIMNLEEEVLDGVDQGMKDFYRAVRNVWREDTEESVHQAQEKLRPGGWLVFEIGWQQQQAVEAIGAAAGWRNLAARRDYGGNPRAVWMQR